MAEHQEKRKRLGGPAPYHHSRKQLKNINLYNDLISCTYLEAAKRGSLVLDGPISGDDITPPPKAQVQVIPSAVPAHILRESSFSSRPSTPNSSSLSVSTSSPLASPNHTVSRPSTPNNISRPSTPSNSFSRQAISTKYQNSGPIQVSANNNININISNDNEKAQINININITRSSTPTPPETQYLNKF